MRRASIGLGLLVAFFLLAMFLMADAEVSGPDDSTAAATSFSLRDRPAR